MKINKYIVVILIIVTALASGYGINKYVRYKNKNTIVSIDLGNGVKMDLKYIEDGSFIMGSKEETGEEDETPEREVIITSPFYIGLYEVTQEQWKQVMNYNPSEFIGDKRPVENVSYEECEIFLEKLSEITKEEFKLPTEAQWEYVCRAGTEEKWFYGESDKECEEYGWLSSNSGSETHEVGTKKENPWGIYDMYGNVQEWCSDWYENPYGQEKLNPIGPVDGDSKIIRGGAWGDSTEFCRSAYRNASGIDIKNNGTGLRVIMTIAKGKEKR